MSSAGSKQVCSEQISFLLKGGCTTQLPSIILSNLDSDLPLYLWWQEEFREPMDPQLWTWVDRVIYDSHGWSDFRSQMRLLELMQKEANQRIVLCDLNWTRLDNLRFALAQFFDHPASHHRLAKISKVRIDFAPGFRSTAILFVRLAGSAIELAYRRGEIFSVSCGSPERQRDTSTSTCASATANRFTKSH